MTSLLKTLMATLRPVFALSLVLTGLAGPIIILNLEDSVILAHLPMLILGALAFLAVIFGESSGLFTNTMVGTFWGDGESPPSSGKEVREGLMMGFVISIAITILMDLYLIFSRFFAFLGSIVI